MGIKLKQKKKENEAPRLASRAANRKSKVRIGRAIFEKREQLETASERAAAHKKGKRRRIFRIVFVTILFLAVFGLVLNLISFSFKNEEELGLIETVTAEFEPTIELVDEAMSSGGISSRMREYVGRAERDFRELNYVPIRAVIPAGAIREVDFYLSGWTGKIKMTIDRDTAVSVEDADRMIRYLQGINVSEFEYIDVRVEGKGFWK